MGRGTTRNMYSSFQIQINCVTLHIVEYIYIYIYTGCPTRYQTRHFFNNSNTNEEIATKQTHTTYTVLFISHTMKVLLFKFCCNIFIGVRIIKEMPVSVASGTFCTYVWSVIYRSALRSFRSVWPIHIVLVSQQHFCWINISLDPSTEARPVPLTSPYKRHNHAYFWIFLEIKISDWLYLESLVMYSVGMTQLSGFSSYIVAAVGTRQGCVIREAPEAGYCCLRILITSCKCPAPAVPASKHQLFVFVVRLLFCLRNKLCHCNGGCSVPSVYGRSDYIPKQHDNAYA
jgi:hypothetical protein